MNHLTRCLTNQNRNVSLLVKRFVFNESFLKIDHFKREINFTENKHKKNSTILKQKVLDSFANSSVNFDFKDLNSILFLSKTNEDINLVLNAVKLLLKHTKVPLEQINGLGAQIMRLIYVLDQSDLGVKVLQDKDLSQIFKSSYPKLILMNKLMIEKKYDKVVELFEKYLIVYKDTKHRSDNKFLFPHDQFILVSTALYKMNTKDAFNKMKSLMDSIKIKRLEFVNTSLPRCFLLSIRQNEPEYALKLLSKFENLNVALGFNLSIIALSKMGFIEEALNIVENVLNSKLDSDESKFEGRFFKNSIQTLDDEIKKEKFLESTSGKLKTKFEILKNLINNDKRYLNFDLEDLCKKSM